MSRIVWTQCVMPSNQPLAGLQLLSQIYWQRFLILQPGRNRCDMLWNLTYFIARYFYYLLREIITFIWKIYYVKFLEGNNAVSNPCEPSPCGPNSLCRVVDSTSVCTCLPAFLGSPPNCRPECTISTECAFSLACISNKCSDPCRSSRLCGSNARCETINHNPICSCPPSFTGDPFIACFEMPRKESRVN